MDENFVEHEEEVEGYLARVMQHEFDHLDGKCSSTISHRFVSR